METMKSDVTLMHVLIIDDHPLFREGLQFLLSGLAGELNFSDATSLDDVTEEQLEDAELVLLDLHLGRLSGGAAFEQLRERYVSGKIVVISSNDDPKLIRECIDRGAAGYIPKTSEPSVLIAALQLILSGGIYLPPEAFTESVAPSVEEDTPEASQTLLTLLTGRQRKALQLASAGLQNKVIAGQMDISEGTVKLHLSAAYKALNVHNRTEAVYKLSKHKLVL